jgi:hypothetical protein
MITLTNTTHTLELTTSSASNIDVFISFADHSATGAVLGDQQSLITTATTTVILAAPAASTQRQVKMIIINNTSASSNTVVVKKDISGTEYDLFTILLGPNESAHFTDGQGWTVYTNTGAIKTSLNQGAAPINITMSAVVLAADVINNNATANTIADVTGLEFPVVAGIYYFRFIIRYTSAATATGSRWSVTGPAFSGLAFKVSTPLIATVNSTDAVSDSNMIAYDQPATANGTSPNNTAPAGGAIVIIEGLVTITAAGTFKARFASEVSSSAITAKAGSVVYYQQVA